MSSWWAKDDTRDQKKGRDEGLKNKITNKRSQKNKKNEI